MTISRPQRVQRWTVRQSKDSRVSRKTDEMYGFAMFGASEDRPADVAKGSGVVASHMEPLQPFDPLKVVS